MRRLLHAPALQTMELTARARMFFVVAWATMAIGTVLLASVILAQPGLWVRAVSAIVVIDLLGPILLEVSRRGHTRLASWLLVFGLVSIPTAMAIHAGGILSPGVTTYFIFVMMAGLLLGERGAAIVAVVCATLALSLVVASSTGVLPEQSVHYSLYTRWLINTLYLGVVIVLLWLGTRELRDALSRAESELAERRQAEHRLELALDAGAIGVWEQDLQRNEFHADDRAFALFGLPVAPNHTASLDGWRNLVHPDDFPAISDMLQRLSREPGQSGFAYRITRPDGQLRYIDGTASSVIDQATGSRRIAGVIVDTTERTLSQRERERLVHDLGERVKELELLHSATKLLQNDRPFNRDVLNELVRKMPPAWQYPECCEARITYRDHVATTAGWRDSQWRQSASFSTTEGKGQVEVVYLASRPESAEGPFLAEERSLIASLAEMLAAYIQNDVAQRQRNGLESQLRQSQKMQALGTLAGGIAHDFNNILTAIGGNAEMARMDVPAGHPVQTAITEIRKAYGRAKDLVKRILLFSRKQESEHKPMPLSPVVEEALRLLQASVPKMVQVKATYASDLPPIMADASQMHQIVMNLGTNAAYAMGAKGGVLSVDVDRVSIDAANAPSADLKPGPHVRLTIRDTGTGMSREILDRLFEPFFTTKGHEGTGLGLSVVHGIVRDHGGAIVVDSEIGRGTAFQLYFPAVAAASEAKAKADGLIPGRGQHIMYVDDEDALVYVMTRTLDRLGYKSTGFSDSAAALHAFRTNPGSFDAVIADFAMPTMTGVQLAQAMVKVRADVPVILTSGYGVEHEASAEGSVVAARLHKPTSMDELSQVLDRVLRGAAR